MPDLDALTGIQPLSVWIAGALLVVFFVICVAAVRRSGSSASVSALFGVPALVVVAWSAWNFTDHAIRRQSTAEREALDARGLQLMSTALAPGSALACLDAGDPTVQGACESALFRRPETVAAAIALVDARLRLLADGLDYARRSGRDYAGVADLRRRLEPDPHGFVAHVLMTRDGCSPESCVTFALLRDAGAVRNNMRERRLETTLERYAALWSDPRTAPIAAAPGATAAAGPPDLSTLSAAPVTKPIDFPSAASIPPVSIMTEPAAPPPPPAEAAPARRAPPAAAARPQ